MENKKMNILVVGSGGREHALADAAARSPLCGKLYMAPGNPGMESLGQCVNTAADDLDGLVELAREKEIDLTIVGPEVALAMGIADRFKKAGLKIFGPDQHAAQVESSKDFAKQLMKKHDIPTAAFETFTDLKSARDYVRAHGAPIVIKENGLKAGKGVTVAMSEEEALEALDIAFAIEDNAVVIEEYLEGFEFSLIALVHDELVIPLECAQDHKRVGDGDKGPNTGGMGSYSPVRAITDEMVEKTMETIMIPMARALKENGTPFTGFLYGGLMVTKDGIKTIEFNARFGDPEAEVILPRLESDFIQAILDVMEGKVPELVWSNKTSHGVVLASAGYPQGSTKGAPVLGLENVDAWIFHMGTARDEQGNLITAGGRVLMVTSLADSLAEAMAHTYEQLKKIDCPALFYRTDIGKKDI